MPNEISTGRKNIMLGTAGHVDHGKTALVKLLTGCNTDTLAEERARGLTIDLGFAPCRLADRRVVGVVDVPGHVDFIRHMVAGAQGIDVVVLVVAADDGVMPQTVEHLSILSLMGLRHGLVALTKVDLVDAARREQVEADVRRLLAGTFLEAAPVCPLSNVTGEGYGEFFDTLNESVNACETRDCTGLFRAWVEDVLTVRGFGTVITGIPASGIVRIGDALEWGPGGTAGRVRRLEVYGEDAAEGRAGECVAINVPEFDREAVRRGHVLGEPNTVAATTLAEGELGLLGSMRGCLKDYSEVHLHVGTASVLARVAMLETDEMAAGQRQMVQLRLAGPLGLAPGDRFVIRADVPGGGQNGLTTVGGGRILGTSNVRLRRRKPWTLNALAQRREAIDHPARWCALMLREAGRPLRLSELARGCRRRPEETAALLAALAADLEAVETPSRAWVHRDSVRQAADRVLEAVRAFHQENPQRLGLEPQALLRALSLDEELFDHAVASLLHASRIVRAGALVAVAGWQVALPTEDQGLADRIAAELRAVAWAPPALDELAATLRQAPPRVERLLTWLAERGQVVKLADRLFMHRDAVEAGRQTAAALFARAPSFSTMQFRDALGVSRKYAVPLLDYLDKTRFTVRQGNTRTPGAAAGKPGAAGETTR